MDALTTTEPLVFVIDIKTIPALSHLTNQPRQKSRSLLPSAVCSQTYRSKETGRSREDVPISTLPGPSAVRQPLAFSLQ